MPAPDPDRPAPRPAGKSAGGAARRPAGKSAASTAPAPAADRTAGFVAEARAVVASLGGINPASLARLRAVAQKHGLAADEMRAAIRSLNDAPPPRPTAVSASSPIAAAPAAVAPAPDRAAPPARPKEATYPAHVAAEVKKLKVLWPGAYERLIDAAAAYGVDELDAMELIDKTASEGGVRFVSMTEAEEMIVARAGGLFDRGDLGMTEFLELQQAAREAGVPPDRFKVLMDGVVRPRPKKAAGVGWLVAAGLLVAVAAGGVGAAGYGLGWFDSPPPETVEAPPPAPPPPQPAPPTPAPPAGAGWGTPELSQLLDKAAAEAPPNLAAGWKQAAAPAPAARAQGYRRLTQNLKALDAAGAAGPAALAACYAAEPSDENAVAILAAAQAGLPSGPRRVPDEDEIDLWFAAAGLAGRMVAAPGVSTDRAGKAAKAIEVSLGGRPDAAARGDELVARVQALAATHVFERLATAARAAPSPAIARADASRPRAEKLLAADALARLETEIAVAALTAPGAFRAATDPGVVGFVGRVAASGPAARVRLLGVYDASSGGPVRDVLEAALLDATGAPKGATPGETAANVRAALAGGGNGATRTGRLTGLTRVALGKPTPIQPTDQLREAVTLAHYSALACALVGQTRPNEARFDELVAKPPEFTAPMAPGMPPGGMVGRPPVGMPGFPPGVLPGKRPPVMRLPAAAGDEVKLVRQLTASAPATRMAAFTSLCELAANGSPSAETADAIARYVVRSLPADEAAQAKSALTGLTDPRVLLAVADTIGVSSTITKLWAESLLGELLGRAVSLPATEWKAEARRLLLRQLADPGVEDTLAQAATRYKEALTAQGRLLGLDEPDFLLRDDPSAVLELLVRQVARRVAADKVGEADRRFLDQLPHLPAALAHQRLNDLQKTVALQRAYLRVLCMYVAQKRPPAADRAARLVADLAADDARSPDALAWLRAGEEKTLRAWLILVETP